MAKIEGGRFLCFSIGNEKFAIPLLQVKEVIGMAPVRSVPLSPNYFLGILNLREAVISIVDLRVKLGITKSTNTDENSIIILEFEGISIGVVVDSVDSVTPFAQDQLSEPPIRDGASRTEYIVAVARMEKSMTLVVDMEKVFNIEEMKKISGQGAGGFHEKSSPAKSSPAEAPKAA